MTAGNRRRMLGALLTAVAVLGAAPVSIVYAAAPTGLLKLASFMAKTGELKAAPASWQDVFFPLLGARKGS